jgi:hypothetical protein
MNIFFFSRAFFLLHPPCASGASGIPSSFIGEVPFEIQKNLLFPKRSSTRLRISGNTSS